MVVNPSFKIMVALIATLSSETENQGLKYHWNFESSPVLIFVPYLPGYEGANKFIRNSPIRISFSTR